jgi:hypothetical protein
MSIQQTMCSSFKQQLFLAQHDLSTDVIKIALYTSVSDIGPDTTVYVTTAEVVGAGYTAGGIALTGASVLLSGATAYVDFNDAVWPAATFTARGALLYNSSKANKAVAVLDFGADKTVAVQSFTVQMPTNVASSALLRIA